MSRSRKIYLTGSRPDVRVPMREISLSGGEPRIPLPVAMGNFLTTDNAPWNLLMAVSTVYSIPPVVLYYVFKRYLVSGLVSGAVSGT